jgi:hypothetical protein
MKKLRLIFIITTAGMVSITACTQEKTGNPPSAEISNNLVKMKLYLPDAEKGYYRATRFDWSGLISSLEWQGHQFFGQWKETHDPLVHEDLSGPVEASVMPGLGYNEAKPGENFIRLGVGVLEKPDEKEFHWDHTYQIVDHGKWTVNQGKDWIEFKHEIKSGNGWGYVYTKKISLKDSEPGFVISHQLKNTGNHMIEIDQFNHNFFMIDGDTTGKNFIVRFPYPISTESDLKGIVKLDSNELTFVKDLKEGTVWLELKGYGPDIKDHQITVINKKSGVGVSYHVDKPLYKQVFWACPSTLCPENFILLKVNPGMEENWTSDYTLFESPH